ncbi:hypothetical protein AB8Y00_15140, partial [Listeria monocytogenes]|uniref:hypothetical protein n=1 Tax=Listeria monocytogenes TaxID=1639 RepID=UPI00350E4247
QADLVFLEYLKVEWEAEPSVFRPLFCGTSFQFGFRRQTLSLLSRLGLKLSFLLKHIVRAGPGDPESSLSYAAIDVGCRGFP